VGLGSGHEEDTFGTACTHQSHPFVMMDGWMDDDDDDDNDDDGGDGGGPKRH
jgi:hypothetical protein